MGIKIFFSDISALLAQMCVKICVCPHVCMCQCANLCIYFLFSLISAVISLACCSPRHVPLFMAGLAFTLGNRDRLFQAMRSKLDIG